jgi:hypothetical protein
MNKEMRRIFLDFKARQTKSIGETKYYLRKGDLL